MREEKGWQGIVRMELSGEKKDRFVNLCGMNGITLKTLIPKGESYLFTASCRDMPLLTEYARKADVRLIVCKERSTRTCLKRIRKHLAFGIGSLLCGGIILWMTQCVWTIRFEGNSQYTSQMLKKTLADFGYHIGMRKESVEGEKLEMYLREQYEDINWVSVELSGEVMTVMIKENPNPIRSPEQTPGPCRIVAEKAGEVVSVVTRKGIPRVKAGDSVEEGSVLIEGEIPLINDNGESIGVQLAHADGEIVILSSQEKTDAFPLLHKGKWYTGKERYQLELVIFGKEFFLDGNVWGFETYDRFLEKGESLSFCGLELPVSWEWTIIAEYREIDALYSKKGAEEKATDYLELFFANLYEKGVQIVEKNVKIESDTGYCTYQASLVTKEPVGIEVPIETTGLSEDAAIE